MIRVALATVLVLVAGVAAASEVELRQSEQFLTKGLPTWSETSLRAEWSPDRSAGVGVTASTVERFALRDWALAAAAHAPLGRFDLGLEASGSTTHQVVPAWSAGARASYAFGGGVVAGTGFRWARYESATVISGVGIANAGLEYYFGNYRIAWTSYLSVLHSDWSTSHALAADLFYRGRDRIGIVLAAGTELESLGGGRVVATDVLSAALLGRSGLGAGWSLTYGLELQRQGDLYSRSGGRLGVVCEF